MSSYLKMLEWFRTEVSILPLCAQDEYLLQKLQPVVCRLTSIMFTFIMRTLCLTSWIWKCMDLSHCSLALHRFISGLGWLRGARASSFISVVALSPSLLSGLYDSSASLHILFYPIPFIILLNLDMPTVLHIVHL